MSKKEEDVIRKHEIRGQLLALKCLANEVRLDCQRYGYPMQAAAIKMMQDALLQIHRMGV